MERDDPTSEPEPVTAPDRASGMRRVIVLIILAAIALAAYFIGPAGYRAIMSKPPSIAVPARSDATPPELAAQSVKLSEKQLAAVKVAPIEYRDFQIEKTATGNIDFNQDKSVQVFTQYQGRIIALFAKLGDAVKAGETLFAIDSPDLFKPNRR
jgi:cobalt-zinc-cadmium efflux system membrane fusion protein